MNDLTETTNANVTYSATVAMWHKPEGRGRKFSRHARGLARRMRLPFVRATRYEYRNPQVHGAESYGPPWTSDHALADFSFACTCHKNERYDRRKGR